MKQLLFILSALFTCTQVTAQKNFEGVITYRLHASIGDKPDAELKIMFGSKKLKLLFREREEFDPNALIVLLDSAASYALDFEKKTYRKTPLILSLPAKIPEKKQIGGYSTTSLTPANTGLSGLLGGMLGSTSAVFYLADSLFFDIPSAFNGNKELIAIQQNRIVLGADIQIINPFSSNEDTSLINKPNIITVEAFNIEARPVDENEFAIPEGFINQQQISYSPTLDSAVAAMDTAIAVQPSPARKPVKKKPAKPAAPKSKQAPKAATRKEP